MSEGDQVTVDPIVEALKSDIAEQSSTALGRLRGDINHLIRPLIGAMRVAEHFNDPEHLMEFIAHDISRLYLVLELVDEAYSGKVVPDERRAEHGVGNNHYEGLCQE